MNTTMNSQPSDECAICYQKMVLPLMLTCNHSFCFLCIKGDKGARVSTIDSCVCRCSRDDEPSPLPHVSWWHLSRPFQEASAGRKDRHEGPGGLASETIGWTHRYHCQIDQRWTVYLQWNRIREVTCRLREMLRVTSSLRPARHRLWVAISPVKILDRESGETKQWQWWKWCYVRV